MGGAGFRPPRVFESLIRSAEYDPAKYVCFF